jgi:hypothetical protein
MLRSNRLRSFLLTIACFGVCMVIVTRPGVATIVEAQDPTIARGKVMQNAREYEQLSWYCGQENTRCCIHPDDGCFYDGNGDGCDDYYDIYGYRYSVGWHVSVPYKWGGGDSIPDFLTKLGQGHAAGDTSGTVCVLACATGVDCSGFITRVWGRQEDHLGTGELAGISTQIGYTDFRVDLTDKMRMGDIFDDYAGSERHVVLHYYFKDLWPYHPVFYEASWDEHKVWLNRYQGWDKIKLPEAEEPGEYRPYRYNDIVDDVYLPHVMANFGGWNSTIIVRNNGPFDTYASITFFNETGGEPVETLTKEIKSNGIWIRPLTSGAHNGSAVVNAKEDVSVVVYTANSSKGYAYTGIAHAGSAEAPGFAVASTELHLPIIFYGHSGWYSRIAIQNTSTSQTTVTLYPENRSPRNFTIPPMGVLFLDDELSYIVGAPYHGSVRIVSNQPVAAIVSHHKDTSSIHVALAHNAAATGAPTNFHPILFNFHSDWLSGVPVRNIGSSGTTATLYYYYQSGTFTESRWVQSGGSTSFYLPGVPGAPRPSYGQGVVQASQPLVSASNHTKYLKDVALGYNGFLDTDGTSKVIVPLTSNGYSGLLTGVPVQNVGNQGTNVSITFYNASGQYVCSEGPVWVQPQKGHSFYQPAGCPGSGFVGSAVVTASGGDARIVAHANATNYGASYAFGYSGINR